MRSRRKFSPEFKSQIVLQLVSGEKSLAQVCREHQLTSQMVNQWKQQFLAHARHAFEPEAVTQADQQRIAELERMVGKLTMELEIAKKASNLLSSTASRNGRLP
jgi:transposase-like protein